MEKKVSTKKNHKKCCDKFRDQENRRGLLIKIMIKIKPISLGLPTKQANMLFVRPIINSTSDTSCNTYYEVIAVETKSTPNSIEGEPDTTSTSSTVMATGNCPINEEQYTAWADDNSYIEDIVIAYLGLERE